LSRKNNQKNNQKNDQKNNQKNNQRNNKQEHFRLWNSGLKSVGPNKTCTFYDGSQIDNIDVIVSCTGYRSGAFPFLSSSLMEECREEYVVGNEQAATKSEQQKNQGKNPPLTKVAGLNLYRRILHPKFPTLGFLTQFSGFANEAACGQLQARWFAHVLSLASTNEKKKTMVELAKEKTRRHLFWKKTTPLYPSFVNVTKYLDLLAKDIGCLPPSIGSIWTWLSDPVLAWNLLVGPVVPSQFSLRGVGVNAEEARLSRELIVGGIRSRL